MKEEGHVYLYISDSRRLVSRIGDWVERALIYHFRKGLASRILDLLASHSSLSDSLPDLLDVALERHTRYHERKKEKNNFQEKKLKASKSVSSHPQNSSISNHRNQKN
ncbi:hypothetical protein O181_053600 [Austropuccinia psidii MF-1]|uniref:Uncharacterized protein n=1 Tax=Austropuccinia psidii MF-1 TaxID=1389203 RepID=A0A9Q3E0X0_9BASI|nr:hypothetical protein [Austropuccinia psidii MF-1]